MASADLLNFPLLEHTAKKGKPIIVSTGMANLSDVDAAVRHLRKFTHRIVLMQCTSTYPSRPEIINLNVLKTYAARYPGMATMNISFLILPLSNFLTIASAELRDTVLIFLPRHIRHRRYSGLFWSRVGCGYRSGSNVFRRMRRREGTASAYVSPRSTPGVCVLSICALKRIPCLWRMPP